jgi:hypothetical protein
MTDQRLNEADQVSRDNIHEPVELRASLTSTKFSESQSDSPPNTLYHYTDQTGLLGIIKESELWATKVQYMNDTTEFGRAVELAKASMAARIRNTRPQSFTKPINEAELLEAITGNVNNIMDVNICSVSFCRHPDILSQWRGYSGFVSGYAIGFFTSSLIETACNHGCRLGRCIYDENVQIEIVDELIDQIVHRSAGYESMHANTLQAAVSDVLTSALIEFGAFFKDPAFAEEDEWRLGPVVNYFEGCT